MTRFTPSQLVEHVGSEMERIGDADLLTLRENRRLLEAWCAARFSLGFSQHFRSCEIDIEETDEQREYDFFFLVDDEIYPFQLTEAQDKGRSRDWEYKKLSKEYIEETYRKNEPLRSEEGALLIKTAVERKHNKHYADAHELNLLVYVNVNVRSLKWIDVKEALTDVATTFASVWLITESMLSHVYGGANWVPTEGWLHISDDT